jgi:hypothetical protein
LWGENSSFHLHNPLIQFIPHQTINSSVRHLLEVLCGPLLHNFIFQINFKFSIFLNLLLFFFRGYHIYRCAVLSLLFVCLPSFFWDLALILFVPPPLSIKYLSNLHVVSSTECNSFKTHFQNQLIQI